MTATATALQFTVVKHADRYPDDPGYGDSWDVLDPFGDHYTWTDHEDTAHAFADRYTKAMQKGARVKITRTEGPSGRAYNRIHEDTITDDQLGTIKLHIYADQMPSVRHYLYRDDETTPGEYSLSAYIDGTLTIHGRTYTNVEVTMRAEGDGAEPFHRPQVQCYDGLTDAARDAIKAHAWPLMVAWLADHDTAELKKDARNRKRQIEMDRLASKIAALQAEYDTFQAEME